MRIGELARRSGLSIHTIRYYEAIGLLPCPSRDQSGKRSYDISIFAWIDFLARLKAAEMPIKAMISYAELWQRGPATAARRRKLLEELRERVCDRITELKSCLGVIDTKILKLNKLEEG
ncbi:MAG: MerR family transcriptional regulator [Verrucomicrobia bacterium]|nr:MerR family transcriptional regulator [Verrucomicrobiota bacterium]